jgi:hypothetical protein
MCIVIDVRNAGKVEHDTSNDPEYIGIVEVGESVFYIELHKNGYLSAGTACNTGIIHRYKQKFDDCFSKDENLQSFIEMIEQKEVVNV